MGDCCLRVQISKRLLLSKEQAAPGGEHADQLTSVSSVWAADTTLYDVLERTTVNSTSAMTSSNSKVTLLKLVKDAGATVWDCTFFPAVPITELCNSETSRTTTLYTLKWFPSGSVQILPCDAPGMVSGSLDVYDDRQYNNKTGGTVSSATTAEGSSSRVQLIGAGSASSAALLPSQVLHAVTKRFGDEDNAADEAQETLIAQRQRQQNRAQQLRVEQARAKKLDDRIRKLREKQLDGKKKAVSDQVQRMLIKSRSTGRAQLKAEDRVYLCCVLWRDDSDAATNEEDYRFFSKQDTVGRALSTFATKQNQETEMLICINGSKSDSTEYRRLPSGLRFYEAIAKSHLTGAMDTVVIRWYRRDQGATTAITDVSAITDSRDSTVAMEIESVDTHQTSVIPSPVVESLAPRTAYTQLADALKTLEQSKKTKRASTAAAKVRHMQMKSKAKGDAKRVKMPERFFFELVVAVDDGFDDDSGKAASSPPRCCCTIQSNGPVFLAKSDPLERLLRDCVLPRADVVNESSAWELLVPTKDDSGTFRRITSSDDTTGSKGMSWESAERSGVVECFDRVILRFFIA